MGVAALPPPWIIPLVETADMEMAVMVVTTLQRRITSRPWTWGGGVED